MSCSSLQFGKLTLPNAHVSLQLMKLPFCWQAPIQVFANQNVVASCVELL